MKVQITRDMTTIIDTLWTDSNKEYITNGYFLIKNSLSKITSKKVEIVTNSNIDNSLNNLLNFTFKELIVELDINSFKEKEPNKRSVYTPIKRCFTTITTPNGEFDYFINSVYIKPLKQFTKMGGKLKLGISIPSKKDYLKLSDCVKPINQTLKLELNNQIVGTLAPVTHNRDEAEYTFTK